MHTCTSIFRDKPKKLASILRSSQAFFTEVISTLCFGATEPPEEQLIQMLISTVFTEKHAVESELLGTRDFNYREIASDQIPTIRSFLLQLLLEHKCVGAGVLFYTVHGLHL